MREKFISGVSLGKRIGKGIKRGFVIGCVLGVVVGMPVFFIVKGFIAGMPLRAAFVMIVTIVTWNTITKFATVAIDKE